MGAVAPDVYSSCSRHLRVLGRHRHRGSVGRCCSGGVGAVTICVTTDFGAQWVLFLAVAVELCARCCWPLVLAFLSSGGCRWGFARSLFPQLDGAYATFVRDL